MAVRPFVCGECFRKLATPLRRPPPSFARSNLISIPRRRFTRSTPIALPIQPVDPASLPKATPARHYTRSRKWLRRLLWTSALFGTGYLVDKQFYASSFARSLRTFGVGIIVAVDYKVNFRAHPYLYNSLEELHAHNAQRFFDLLRNNGGLYLKIGQAVAMQSAILPPEFQKMFARMFDDAPQNTWDEVERVVREDFGGKSPEDVFGISFSGESDKGIMERTARASASVAQVHWARLADGREVAVKIQKREIAQQVGWDLWTFKVIAKAYTWWFDIPIYSMVPYITERLMLETDFVNEADNSERMKELVEGESRLKGRVYIPKIYRELSSKRIMTAEWIEGIRLWDKDSITAEWRGGWRTGSPGCAGTPLSSPSDHFVSAVPRNDPNDEKLKPDRNGWRGSNGKGGLGLTTKAVMSTMVDLFSAQMFRWGWVHCDPHPGNIFIRRQPSGKAELVLIDHGLYIHMDPKFRHDYALFWKSLMTFDNATIATIAKGWGVDSPDIFASATLLRPYTGGDQSTSTAIKGGLKGKDEQERAFEMQQQMRKGVRKMLGDETKWPRELIFIGRNMRIVQGNNQFLGSPVNRLKITGNWASLALVESPDLPYRERFQNFGRHLIFKFVLFGSDLVFFYSKIKQYLGVGKGMEDDLENQMKSMAKGMGVDLNHNVFDG